MARADLILQLVKSGAQGDQAKFRKIVEALAADERSKRHTILADRLLAQLGRGTNGSYGVPTPPTVRGDIGPLVSELVPTRCFEEMILPQEADETIRELVEEQFRADLLRSYNLEPRNRVLLAGPPGNGKTTLAEAIANALSVPFLVVRYEAIIGSYLGETAQRIEQAFEYARSRRCVLFFDEFDAVGKERGDRQETGEIKRVVSSLLLQVDAMPSYVIVVVASNHPELLDRAVWRRFQIRLELPMPTQSQIEEWITYFEKRTKHDMGRSPRSIARSLRGLSFAEVEDFGADVLRKIVLSEPNVDTAKITEGRLRHWRRRFSLGQAEAVEHIK